MNKEATVFSMNTFGGSFVKALSEAFKLADETNFNKLKSCFPEIWEQYEKMSALNSFKKTEIDLFIKDQEDKGISRVDAIRNFALWNDDDDPIDDIEGYYRGKV